MVCFTVGVYQGIFLAQHGWISLLQQYEGQTSFQVSNSDLRR